MSDTKHFKGFAPPVENFSKLPHEFIGLLPEIDSLAELKVVLYILRHTWGFSEFDKPKKMTLDELQNGRKKRDGTRMDGGTGLSVNSIKSGVEKAIERGILTVETDESDMARIEKWYCLNMSDESNFDAGLSKVDNLPSKVDNRTEKETIERKEISLKTDEVQGTYRVEKDNFDTAMAFERLAEQAKQSGYWQGRENIPPHLLKYADWWNKRTGQVMKGKVKSDYLKEWTAWNNDELPISALDEAFDYVNGWKGRQGGKVAHPREITKDAAGFAAHPKQEETKHETGKGFYG